MAFETITPGGSPASSTVPSSPPGSGATEPGKTGAPAAQAGITSVEDALKGADHAKMNTFSVSDLSKQPAGSGPAGSSVSIGGLVQGKVLVDLMDSLLPAILVLIFHRMGLETRKSQYQLTQGEKNTLAPIVDACLQSINMNFDSPWTTLTVSLLVIYGGKAMEVGGTGWLDKKSAEKTPAKTPASPVVPLKVVQETKRPEPAGKPAASTNNDDFRTPLDVVQAGGPPVWTDADVSAVVKKRKCSKAKAVQWLNDNWAKGKA